MQPTPTQEDLFNARRGDRSALDRLLAKHQDRFRIMAQAEIGDGLRAKLHTSDLLQSAYMDVVRSVQDFEGETEEQFVRWFGRILNNNVRDRARYFAAEKRDGGILESSSRIADMSPTPSSVMSMAEGEERLGQNISELLTKLSPDQKRAIELRFDEGLAHEEIAELMDRTPEAIRVLVSRARSNLALLLQRKYSKNLKL